MHLPLSIDIVDCCCDVEQRRDNEQSIIFRQTEPAYDHCTDRPNPGELPNSARTEFVVGDHFTILPLAYLPTCGCTRLWVTGNPSGSMRSRRNSSASRGPSRRRSPGSSLS